MVKTLLTIIRAILISLLDQLLGKVYSAAAA